MTPILAAVWRRIDLYQGAYRSVLQQDALQAIDQSCSRENWRAGLQALATAAEAETASGRFAWIAPRQQPAWRIIFKAW
jgi:hypothetical protein